MRALVLLVALFVSTEASAADLTVMVRTAAGKPVRDAVVTVYPASGAAGPSRLSGPYRMVQQNIAFDPFVMVAPVGAEVSFPNKDTVRHHVYSFSPAHPFELKLYGKDETRTVRFDKAGVIALGCNIHDQMVAFIKVVDTPYAAKTGEGGEVVLHGLPAGGATVHVWHPYMKSRGNEVVRTLTIGSDRAGHEQVSVDLLTPPDRRHAY